MARRKYGVILGGGTARGAVQPPILRRLRAEHGGPPAAIAGVSVGAVNAALAGEDRLDELDEEWARIDGTRSFARRTLPGLDIARTLAPTRARLEARAASSRLVCPVWVGLVDIASKSYRAIALHSLPNLRDRWDAIIGSARQPLLMVEELFQGRPVMDGGAGGHVLPPLPNWTEMDEIHIVSCSPLGQDRVEHPDPPDRSRGVKNAIECFFDLSLSRIANEDIEDLREYARKVPTYLYAPTSWAEVGPGFAAKPEDIAMRLETGERMYRNRQRLTIQGPMRRPVG